MDAASPALRRNDHDVTDRVCVADPAAVERAVARIIATRHADFDRAALHAAFALFGRIYSGRELGWVGCEAWYHDAQHSLDVTLAIARLVDGCERDARHGRELGARRAVLGAIAALFHDVGYVRRNGDAAAHGAAYTLTHVERSGAFLEAALPRFGFTDEEAADAHEWIHFTGYERPLDSLRVDDPADRQLGHLVATADLLAQTADRCYLEKCRDFLFPEFELAGLAGPRRPDGPVPLYDTVETLLHGTPEFNARLWRDRLDGVFHGAHRFIGVHLGDGYGGSNPYAEAIRTNLARVQRAIDEGDRFDRLRRRPRAIRAAELTAIIDGAQ